MLASQTSTTVTANAPACHNQSNVVFLHEPDPRTSALLTILSASAPDLVPKGISLVRTAMRPKGDQ